jgi:hypothetical protein
MRAELKYRSSDPWGRVAAVIPAVQRRPERSNGTYYAICAGLFILGYQERPSGYIFRYDQVNHYKGTFGLRRYSV